MARSYPLGDVCAKDWFVSRSIHVSEPTAPRGGTLSVRRRWPDKPASFDRPGDANGMTFQSDEDYTTFCRERGYLVPYFNDTIGTVKSIQRHRKRDNRKQTRMLIDMVKEAHCLGDVIEIADGIADVMVTAFGPMGVQSIDGCRWANGVHAIARRFRPDLYERPDAPKGPDGPAKAGWPANLTDDVLISAVKRQTFGLDNPGFCLACGEEHDGCEPDAREYECESCGERKVYGAEELIMMI